ncbi:MAG TPA: thiamine phosphate synthase [Casimicrobiaceae bacterium]|nr:thiamine phosphate synthase [Casimicrobiaceae bacterium]
MPEGRIEAPRQPRAARLAGLYALTPEVSDSATLVAKVAMALAGGAEAIQYRNKSAPAALRRAQARLLAGLCVRCGALFIVNDDVDIAREVDADGVHIGEDDGGVAQARAMLGPDRLVGVSCYDEWERARRAIDAGADYVAFGSFFASATKPDATRADPSLLARAASLRVPVVAIGGITSTNAATLIDAGATAVAVIGDVFARDDLPAIERAAAAIAALFAKRTVSERS